MNEWIDWFQRVLDVSIRLYFRQECDLSSVYDIPLPKAGPLWKALLPEQVDPTFDEWMVLMLALLACKRCKCILVRGVRPFAPAFFRRLAPLLHHMAVAGIVPVDAGADECPGIVQRSGGELGRRAAAGIGENGQDQGVAILRVHFPQQRLQLKIQHHTRLFFVLHVGASFCPFACGDYFGGGCPVWGNRTGKRP